MRIVYGRLNVCGNQSSDIHLGLLNGDFDISSVVIEHGRQETRRRHRCQHPQHEGEEGVRSRVYRMHTTS